MEYSFEFFALVLFVVVLAGILWIFEKTSEAGRNIIATLDSPPVKSDEQEVAEDLAFRNQEADEAGHQPKKTLVADKLDLNFRKELLSQMDAYNEACNMEPVKQPHLGPISPAIAKAHIGISSQQVNQNSASMEPFCGEGKKP